jgi:DnaK suppressor protein
MTVSPTVPAGASFSAKQAALLRAALLDCRDERSRQLADLEDATPNTDPVGAAHRSTVRRILRDVEEALVRMDTGRYGLCVYCAQPIPVARLEALPYATGCVGCLSRRDQAW